MAKLTPQQHWDQVLKREDPRSVKTRRKLTVNRNRNWLIALCAHACAKEQSGGQLSDLEQQLVETLRKASQKTDLVAGLAYVQAATAPEIKSEIFPSGFDSLSGSDSVTFAKLGELAPDLAKQSIAAPNTNNVDVKAIHLGQVKLSQQIKVPPSTIGMHASSLLRVVSPSPSPVPLKTPQIANRYTIKMAAFRCLEETSEWSASDEVYWLYACVAPTGKKAGITHVFNDVDAGEAFTFEPDEGALWGFDGQPQAFPNGEIGALITLMEHDEGDVNDIKDTWFTILGIGEAILVASGAAAWVAAILGGLGGLIGLIIDWAEDDHIADQSYVWDRVSIDEMLGQPFKPSFYDVKNELTDGDARYRLATRITRVV